MSGSHSKRLLLAALVAVLVLACQWRPRFTQQAPTPSPTDGSRLQSLSSTATATLSTPSPVPSTTPVPVTPSPTPTLTPPLPDAGPLPAYWTELDLAAHDPVSGHTTGIYDVFDLAQESSATQIYALGRCIPSSIHAVQGWGLCLSIYEPEIDRVVKSSAVLSPAESVEGEEGRLLLAGARLYVHQPWAGVLYVLDRVSLARTTVLTDVHSVAYDASGERTFVLTGAGLTTFEQRLPTVPVDRKYDTTPLEMVAGEGRVYVLGETMLQVYSQDLQRIAQIELPEGYLTGLLLDAERGRLYIGGYAGLYVLNIETLRLQGPLADADGSTAPNAMAMALDQRGEQLFVLARHQRDWFGGYTAIALDTEAWSAKELYSTQEGELRDLVVDEDSGRLLVASASDHSLLPIFYETLEVAPRLPLGIEVGEVIVDPDRERIYASDSAGWVSAFDRRSYDSIFRVYGGRRISLDAERGILYAGDPRVPVVTQFDAQTGRVVSEIKQAGRPRANPTEGQVVILNRRFYVFDAESGRLVGELLPGVGQPSTECPECYYTLGVEAVVDALRGYTATLTYTPWPGKPGPRESIDYDLGSGRAYYSLLTGGYVHFSSISTYADLSQLERGEPALRTLKGLSGDLALDPSARRLYVARGELLFVLDSETLNRQGRIHTAGRTPTVAAVDTELGRLYLPWGSKLEIWSRTGGATPAPSPPEPLVLTNTVASILPSPNYAQDHTLLATVDGWPARSMDGGETWQRLRGGLPEFDGYRPAVSLIFSPAFADDRRLFAGVALGESHGEGVYCSEDGGDTWHMCSDGLHNLSIYRVQASPAFGRDRTVWAYANTPQGDVLYRSTNAGKSWVLELRQTEPGRPPLPSLGELIYQPEYEPQIECDFRGSCQRSDNGGQLWRAFSTTGAPLENLVEARFSPQYAQDGTIYFATYSDLLRYEENDQDWSRCQAAYKGQGAFGERGFDRRYSALAVAPSSESTHDLLIGSAAGEFYRIPSADLECTSLLAATPQPDAPRPTPAPTPCPEPVDERLAEVLLADKDSSLALERLGCAVAPAETSGAAIQPFEGGSMIWREDVGEIYVLPEVAKWSSYEDTWTDGQPEPDVQPPRGLYAPVRGFGKLWREELDSPVSTLGWATAPEQGATLSIQDFANGLLLYSMEDNRLWVLYGDGTWILVGE